MEAYHVAELTINASRERVWDALTNPDMTQQYMFGCRVNSDWKPGSKADWVGMADGKEVTYVTGEVVVFEPHTKLVYTVIDPAANYPLSPENHLTVTCELSGDGNETHIKASQGDYTKVADGANRYGHGNGWVGVLNAIKELVEAK